MRWPAISAISFLLLALCPAALSFAAELATPEAALQAYQSYLKSIRNVSFRSLSNDRSAEEKQFDNPRTQNWKIDLVGKRLWNSCLIEEGRASNDEPSESKFWEDLTTPDRRISLTADPKTLRADTVLSYLKVPQDYWEQQNGLAYLTFPIGHCDLGTESKSVAALLSTELSSRQSDAQVVLTSKMADCQLSLWLAPSKGWMPERIEYVRIAPVTDGNQIARFSYNVTQAARFGDIWFPTKYGVTQTIAGGKSQLPPGMRVEERVVVENGVESKFEVMEIVEGAAGSIVDVPKSNLVAEVTLAAVKFNALADDDFRLQATIPDGTSVSMQDARQEDFVWQAGKIVVQPRVPELFESFYGKHPPELSITDARGVAKNVRLADFRGRWVLLDFWGLNCGPCISESLPALAKFQEQHATDRDRFVILSVCNNWNGDVSTMKEFDRLVAPIRKEFWDDKPLPFPILLDGDEKTFTAYGIQSIPQTLLIDPDGNLVADGDEETLAEKLKPAAR